MRVRLFLSFALSISHWALGQNVVRATDVLMSTISYNGYDGTDRGRNRVFTQTIDPSTGLLSGNYIADVGGTPGITPGNMGGVVVYCKAIGANNSVPTPAPDRNINFSAVAASYTFSVKWLDGARPAKWKPTPRPQNRGAGVNHLWRWDRVGLPYALTIGITDFPNKKLEYTRYEVGVTYTQTINGQPHSVTSSNPVIVTLLNEGAVVPPLPSKKSIRGMSTTLHMRFNPRTGTVEVIKNGVYTSRGFIKFDKNGRLNQRQTLRNYR